MMPPKPPAPSARPKFAALLSPASAMKDKAPKPAAKEAPKGEAMAASPSMPKVHESGPVLADGSYQLKKGAHVLTSHEAGKARKHALMAAGMKSLAMPKTAGEPDAMDEKHKMPEKKVTSGVTVRPEKKQAAKIADKTKKNEVK